MSNKVLMKGNEAVAEAAIKSGCLHFFGYPITPQTEISEYMAKRLPKEGGMCVQAESEIAAINMIMGASAAGARAMTSSSSPGISLKSEGISYIAGCDLPCVIVNVQRGGPGLGGIQPAQSDYYQATKALGHGDMHVLVIAPNSIQEIVDLTSEAFYLADKYRMPAMMLTDGALGQMMEPVDFDSLKNIKTVDKPWAACGHENKRKNNIINSLYIQPEVLEEKVIERFKKYEEIEKTEVKYEEIYTDDAEIVIVAYGITSRIAKSAMEICREKGKKIGMMRPITLYPFPKKELLNIAKKDSVKKFLVTELNMGQMVDDVRLAIKCSKEVDFYGRTGGMLPTPEEISDKLMKMAEEI